MATEWMWSPSRLEKVSWKLASNKLIQKMSHRGSYQTKIDSTHTWVLIEEIEDRDELDIIDAFCDAQYVIELPERSAQRIRILDSDSNRGMLLLDQKPAPGQNTLYLPPNDYVIYQQRRAIYRLRDNPEPENRGLLRLFENSRNVDWPDVEPVTCDKWEFLTDETVEGTAEQRRFVEISLGTPDFAILEGPPGSGKTTSICELIVQEIRRGHRVMLCASTHVAVDNVLESLQEHDATSSEVLAVRIGNERKISDSVKDFQLQRRVMKEKKDLIKRLIKLPTRTKSQQYLLDALQSSEDVEGGVITRLILESANLVCGTTIGILQHPDIKSQIYKRTRSDIETNHHGEHAIQPFDCLILDEVSKTTFQEFLVPALFCRRWILVGDVRQLSPYVETAHLEDNIRGMISNEDDARVCLDTFHSWEGSRRSTQGILVLDAPEPEKYSQQARHLGLNLVDLSRPTDNVSGLDILGANVILSRKENLHRIERLIPSDFMVSPPEGATPKMNRRHEYWLQHYAGVSSSVYTKESISGWAKNLAWRINRSFELRDDDLGARRYNDEIDSLLPQWYGEDELSWLKFGIETVKRVALPSILELLQKGFGRRAESRSGSCLTDGMDRGSLSERHVRLSYQHRMHPEISGFPREFIYDSMSLKDPHTIERNRTWSYGRYNTRVGWIQTVGAKDFKNMNRVEADIVMGELEKFLRWATRHPKKTNGSQTRQWEVAILTFYRKQESLLRTRIQKMFGKRYRTEFISPDGSTKVKLCTVDRFQGHEADLVILSFVRNRRIGFLDSVNRLNVAITRARYQLILVGNRRLFARQRRDTLLKKLAEKVPSLGMAWEGRNEN